jgi:translation initiation factor IF-1
MNVLIFTLLNKVIGNAVPLPKVSGGKTEKTRKTEKLLHRRRFPHKIDFVFRNYIIIKIFKLLYKMVKNTTGGKGSKSMARKLTNNHSQSHSNFRESTCNFELYAIVTKMLGCGMCYVKTNDHEQIICHIRSKFSGRSKRSNIISVGSYILVGIREWESTIKNCDLLEIYDPLYIPNLSLFPRPNAVSGDVSGSSIEFKDNFDEEDIGFDISDI